MATTYTPAEIKKNKTGADKVVSTPVNVKQPKNVPAKKVKSK